MNIQEQGGLSLFYVLTELALAIPFKGLKSTEVGSMHNDFNGEHLTFAMSKYTQG